MKRKLLLILSLIIVVCMSIFAVGCSNSCDNEPPAHEHTYSTVYSYDNNYHWFLATCEHNLTKDKAKHTFTNGVCGCGYQCTHSYEDNYTCHDRTCTNCGVVNRATTEHSYTNGVCSCGERKPSKGLSYTLSENETYYIVSGIGSCIDTDIVIPITYNNKPVKEICSYAFDNYNSLTGITIPDSVTSIGSYAFSKCDGLTSVEIGDSITSIGSYVFSNCDSLTSVVIGNSVTSIGNWAFSYCDSLTSIVIPDSVRSIDSGAFSGCTSLASIVIPDSVRSIGFNAFAHCDSLTSIVIPDSVTSIDDRAFSDCRNLTSVEFNDTTDWYVTTSRTGWQDKENGTKVNVNTPTNNDDYFKSTYIGYYWYKK